MKHPFDQAGVQLVQQSVISLSASELQIQVNFIRHDFIGWMLERFHLRPHQLEQLEQMSTILATRLANAIASHYERRRMVPFTKETRISDDSDDLKEIILFGLDDVTTTIHSTRNDLVPELAIWIRYKPNL